MALNQIELDHILGQLQQCSSEQLLIINRSAADYFKAQRKIDGRKAMQELQVGTRCMFVGSAKPQYLARELCTVVEIRQTRVLVQLDRGPVGKFRNGRVLCSPSSLVILKNQPQGD